MKVSKIIGKEKEIEWLPYLKNDVLLTAFICAKYSKGLEDLKRFGVKSSSTLPSLANKYFNCLGDENDEDVYTYTDTLRRHFVRQSIKGGRRSALNQNFKSTISDQVFSVI